MMKVKATSIFIDARSNVMMIAFMKGNFAAFGGLIKQRPDCFTVFITFYLIL